MKKKNRLLSGLVVFLVATLFSGCGSSHGMSGYDASAEYVTGDYGNGAYDYKSEESYAPSEAPDQSASMSDYSITDDAVPTDTSRKLITTVNLSCETREFDEGLNTITNRITALGGYIENMDTSNNSYRAHRNASMTIRVPAAKLKDLLGTIEEQTNVTNYSRSVEDITLNYVDTESHIKALNTEQDRLLELLAKADNLNDMLLIEDRLTNVRYQLQRYESTLRSYDNKIDYSTIYLNLSEVVEYTAPEPETMGSRIKEGLSDNFSDVKDWFTDLTIGLVTGVPYLLILLFLAVVIFVIVLVIKWLRGSIGSEKHKEKVRNKKASRRMKYMPESTTVNASQDMTKNTTKE